MTNDLLLKNGLVVTPSGAIRGGLAISGERIVGVGSEETLGGARREIDLQGKIVMPGLFDPHVHLGRWTSPVISDADSGYGEAIDVQRTLRGAALHIEDQVWRKAAASSKANRSPRSRTWRRKFGAALDARRDPNLLGAPEILEISKKYAV